MKKLLLIVLLLAIYRAAYVLLPFQHFLPSLFQLFATLLQMLAGTEIYLNIAASLLRILIGFILASVLGITLGLLLAYYRGLTDLKFYIELLRPIPPIAWIPVAIMLFGLGNVSASFIVFLGAFFPIFTNTYFGAISIPIIFRNVSSSFEVGAMRYFSKILFFHTLPYIFAGLKIGIGMAWMSVIAAELIAAQSGLGYFIQLNRLLLRTDKVILGMMLIGIIGYFLQKIVEYLETKLIVWR